MKKVIIVGTGGHAKVVADIVKSSGDTLLGFFDDFSEEKEFLGAPILGKLERYVDFPNAYIVIAIGSARAREKIADRMKTAKWYTAIHAKAVISPTHVRIGEGTVIMPGAVVNSCAVIGKHCIINTGAIVEHDNKIHDYAHISVGAKLAGAVNIGSCTWVGVGASVSDHVDICADCMIGAGTVVIKDITDAGTYVGTPAKKIIKAETV